MSVGDTITSFKSPKSFEDVLNGDAAAGDRVKGRVPFLLDAFASEANLLTDQTYGYFVLSVSDCSFWASFF